MELQYQEELISGGISLVIALTATYGVSLAFPAKSLNPFIAVAFASFFSGFFSRYYA